MLRQYASSIFIVLTEPPIDMSQAIEGDDGDGGCRWDDTTPRRLLTFASVSVEFVAVLVEIKKEEVACGCGW